MVSIVHVLPTALASFMASLVECVEALTAVLAVGSVRGWKSALGRYRERTSHAHRACVASRALIGTGSDIPAASGVGLLLLLFGLRWLRKAILRSSGAIPLHDEDQAFAKETATLRLSKLADGQWDRVAIATAYKIVMLEGIEVVFIVIALGSSAALILPAVAGAAAALGCVALLGLALHRPLSKIPENTLKFAVGVWHLLGRRRNRRRVASAGWVAPRIDCDLSHYRQRTGILVSPACLYRMEQETFNAPTADASLDDALVERVNIDVCR